MNKALLAAAMLALATPAGAATSAQALPRLDTMAPQSLVEKAGWRGHCSRWRHICADRWGWGTWRFRRCMVLHGC